MTVGFTPDAKPSPAPSPAFTPDTGGFKPDTPAFTADKQQPQPKPKATPTGLYSVNPNVNVVGDYLTRWTKFGMGGIRDSFRTIVDNLSNAFHLGIYDFNKGHHYAPNDPHLDGRAMDVDTINGETVGDKLTPTISNYIGTVLATPGTRVGVPAQIYRALPKDQQARAFIDAPAHIHTELSTLQPGQTVAPRGFKPDPAQGFVKPPPGAEPAPPPGATKSAGQAMTDFQKKSMFGGPTGFVQGGTGPDYGLPTAHSWLNQLGGLQDGPFILENALTRDNLLDNGKRTIGDLWKDPNSQLRQAYALWKADPAAAMDEYGLNSARQTDWLNRNYPESKAAAVSNDMTRNPLVNFLSTFVAEQLNPVSLVAGAGAGKALDVAGPLAEATGVARIGQGAASIVGMGSPLYGLRERGGVEASQWAKGAIASINAPHVLLHVPETGEITHEIFDNLPQAEKDEIVRLKQGLKPDPVLAHTNPDLKDRAKKLADDMATVEQHQQRVGTLPPERTFNTKKYFPMAHTQDFGPQFELEQELKGPAAPGAGGPNAYHKTYQDLDQASQMGALKSDHDLAVNYATWRRQRLQRVAFEDAIDRAPDSIRRDVVASDFHNGLGVPLEQPWQQNINTSVHDTLQQWLDENAQHFGPDHPQRYSLNDNPDWMRAVNLMGGAKSPTLERSMVAPELWQFIQGNRGLQRYIGESFLPGGEGRLPLAIPKSFSEAQDMAMSWTRHYTAIMRNMVISNFLFHPMINVAANDAVARGVYNLGGAQFGRGGYAYNAALSLATQAGLAHPGKFLPAAEEYAHWLDRALTAGGVAEFGGSKYSALGRDWTATMTSPSKAWIDRVDRALTKAGDFNRDRTFGQKGEQIFAVTLFRDAVTKGGLSDAKAGELVRQALGDYYNFDPNSPWSAFFFFMPWLKGNMKFWASTLMRRPQYALGIQHGLRNVGMANSPESYEGSSPVGDFTTYTKGGTPYTMPFVGRDIGKMTQVAGSALSRDVVGAGEAAEQMLMGRATPGTRFASDAITTLNAAFSGDVKGPETDWNMIVNPRAPKDEQLKQAAGYFASHFVPIPLFTYAVEDAARKGLKPSDVGQALITAGGGGYFGEPKLDDYGKRQLKKAQVEYKKAYDNYRYKDFGDQYLKDAWDTYYGKLRDLGIVN